MTVDLLLYEQLPLRSTRQLGDFAEDAPLAHVYGDLTKARFPLRRISATRGHAADHPMEITGAGSGSLRTDSWQAVIEPDRTGHVCTFVDFGAPVPSDDMMWAYGRGKRDPIDNTLIANPGNVLANIAAIGGRTDLFQGLREESAAAGILLAGRVAESKSIRAWLDVPAQSAGAIWAPGMSRRYPGPVSGYVLELDKMTTSLASDPSAAVEDTADILRIAYDWCDATDKPQRYIELTANPQRFGGVVKELAAPWLRTPANAVTVGTPILQRLAGERYDVPLNSSQTTIRPGQWLKLTHPAWPFSGAAPVLMALSVNVNRAARAVEISSEWQRTTPDVSVTAHSVGLDDLSGDRLEVTARSGSVTFTVYDENNRGIQGARVSLDGGQPKTTDARGQVSFPFVAGAVKVLHEIVIEAAGRGTQKLFIPL